MNRDKIRAILNVVFLIMAAIAVITYFTADFKIFFYICIAAVSVKLIEFILRFTV